MSSSGTCFYAILGVQKSATQDEVRKAYRKLAIKWHPDKNINNKDEATEMFKIINEAYATLGDTGKRQKYDQDMVLNNRDEYDQRYSSYSRSRQYENEDFGSRNQYRSNFSDARAHDIFNDFFSQFDASFNDDFFRDDWSPFGSFGQAHPSNPGQTNGFSTQRNGGQTCDGSFGFGGHDPFAHMHAHMNSMMNMHMQQMNNFHDSNTFGWDPHFAAASSFTSNQRNIGPQLSGSSRSVSTTTTIDASGRKTVRTETTIRHPDGTVERSVSSDAAPSIAIGSGFNSNVSISRNPQSTREKATNRRI